MYRVFWVYGIPQSFSWRVYAEPPSASRNPLFSFAQFGDSAFQKTRLVVIPEDTCIDVDDPNQLQTDATECAEQYEIDDSDLEEGNADLECLIDYCF